MKKLFILLVSLFIASSVWADTLTIDPFISGDDVSIAHLEQFRTRVVSFINSFPGGNIQTATITHTQLDANSDPTNRWNEAFNDFVYTGLLPTVPGGVTLAMDTPAGTAYINGYRVVKALTGRTYTASKDTYVDLSYAGVYTYQEKANGETAPSVAANSIRLFKVVTDGTPTITSVSDLRVTSISISINADNTIVGLDIDATTPDDAVTIDSGVLYHGTSRIAKTSRTTLDLDTGPGNWWDNVVDVYAAPDWCYIGVNATGDIRFIGNNPPDYSDVSGNATTRKLYWKTGTDYWRVIGALSVDATNNIAYGFLQNGRNVMFDTQQHEASGLPPVSWTTLELTNVPRTARKAKIFTWYNTSGNDQFNVREYGRGGHPHGFTQNSVAPAVGAGTAGQFLETNIDTSGRIEYWATNAANVFYIWTLGYEDNTR